MWIIQNETLLSIPDDAPLPPNSVKVEPPADFKQNPLSYRIKGSGFIRSKAPPPEPSPQLTPEEIIKIKKAIKRGEIK